MSSLYDKAVAKSGTAERELRNERRKRAEQAARRNLQIAASYPALAEAEDWLAGHGSLLPLGQHLEIPVFI